MARAAAECGAPLSVELLLATWKPRGAGTAGDTGDPRGTLGNMRIKYCSVLGGGGD